MEIGDWLRGLGLSQYEAAFRENSIDLEILRKLTSEDLKDLGVASVGHRRRLLAAIEELSSTGLATSAVAGSAAAGIAEATSAERRHLTVMIVDLVGSTALAARLDPEDMRDVLAAYHTCCAGLIASNGGFVARYMGDGVLAYFGYPQAHEQDAENAVRAALAIVAAAPKLNTAAGAPLHARVGVATGSVVVGDLLGSGEAQERDVVGDTPNLAARLQGIAEPDRVVIDEGTRELLGNLFELQDLGTRDLKGIARPARAWAALGASPVASHFEALHGTALTPLVGREEECELLLRRWARAKDGEGQVVLLSGEAGIGKSRLAVSLIERLADEPLTLPRYFCSPQHTDDALFPIIGEMERAARFARDDTLRAKLDKLDALLEYMSTPAEDAALFAEMLSLKPDGRYPAIDLAPPQRRQRTLHALVAQIEALTSIHPMLMIFEDAQWSDPTSLEALSRIVDRIRTLRALLIVTFRPEFDAPWIGQSHVTTLILNRLAERDIGVMIGAVAGARPLPATIRRDIVERSDGVPLFVEEMTKAVLEADGEGKAVGNRSLTVPATLQASLMARLDRLGPAKEVAQVAAAIGRESSHSLLVLVANLAEPDLNVALDHLVRAGLLSRRGVPPDATYLFKHALLQDLAHGALLREPRRVLHMRIAQALEAHFPDVAQSQPQVLARHCAEAGLFEKAAALWGRAGRKSMERSAVVEAEFQFSQALAQIAELPSSAALRREQIKLQAGLISAMMFSRGYTSATTKAALRQAQALIDRSETLGEPMDDPQSLYIVLEGFFYANHIAPSGGAALEIAQRYLALAQKRAALAPLIVGHRMVGEASMFVGNILASRAHYDQAIALYDPTKDHNRTKWGGVHWVGSMSLRALALWLLGYPVAAQSDAAQALSIARNVRNAVAVRVALLCTTRTHLFCGQISTARAEADEFVVLADETGEPYFKALGLMFQGLVYASGADSPDAVGRLEFALSAYRSMEATLFTPNVLSHLAEAHARLGQFDDAWRCIDDAITTIETSKERCAKPTFFASQGKLRWSRPNATPRRLRHISTAPSRLRGLSRRNPGNCARRPARRASYAINADARRLKTYLRPSTPGSPRASTRST